MEHHRGLVRVPEEELVGDIDDDGERDERRDDDQDLDGHMELRKVFGHSARYFLEKTHFQSPLEDNELAIEGLRSRREPAKRLHVGSLTV